MTNIKSVPSVSVDYACNGSSTKANEMGMRAMQERAYEKRGEQYLLIKSPPASGKSRALMFVALDKLHNQGLKKAIIVVPEKSIGSSFNDEPLSKYGFWMDWVVAPQWNLCNAPGDDNGGKVGSVKAFLESPDRILVCTHATFRFAIDRFGVEVFDNCLIAVDEFHHVSANPDNKLGMHLGQLITRDKAHIVAMTGSYFRGDAEAVLSPSDEAKFEPVTYTYYEQLNGYQYLKHLDIGYFFYSGSYIEEITEVLDVKQKTIIHIPNVNSRESTQRGKTTEVSEIMDTMGVWKGKDSVTGFDLVECADGRILKIADLVDDGPERHSKVLTALKDPSQKDNRDHVDVIIALGMAKEGFDWIWCEHALTIGYRSSLTEIIQIIGRATRDAKGKTRSRFTNLIAEPDASAEKVTDAVNDTLKAIAASLLMEQVLAPKFNFTPKNPNSGPIEGFDYGENGYDPSKANIGFNKNTGQFQIEIKGLAEPKSKEASRICQEDLNEVIAAFVQDKTALERGLFDSETVPEELTQVRMGKIVKDKYPELDEEDQEVVRQHAIAALNMTQQAKKALTDDMQKVGNTALIDGVRKFAMDVRDLDIDLIDSINPFSEAYSILAKAMNENSLKQVASVIAGRKTKLSPEEAKELASRAVKFKKERGRLPSLDSADPWEKRMAEGAAAFVRYKDEEDMSDFDLDELRAELDEFSSTKKDNLARLPKEDRIIGGFVDIERFFENHGRAPSHGEDKDIFERVYAVRLDKIRSNKECMSVLMSHDKHGLLKGYPTPDNDFVEELDDDEILSELGDIGKDNDITKLTHVRTRAEVKAAEEIAQRSPCLDFVKFKELFIQVQEDLISGTRKTREFKDNPQVKVGEFFILGGQKVYVAEMGEEIKAPNGDLDARLRVIYDNGTESNLLLRSLQRALYKDEAGRRITDPTAGPLFSDETEDGDTASGTIYVLRSKSEHPQIKEHRDVIHKIGVTSGDLAKRFSNAKLDPTFLMADIEVVATFELSNINRTKLENLIHRFFEPAKLNIEISDRFGNPIVPREWFLVPFFVIDEAVDKIKDGSIVDYRYDPKSGKIVKRR